MATKTSLSEQTINQAKNNFGLLDYLKQPQSLIILILNLILVFFSSIALWFYSSKILAPVSSNLLTPAVDQNAVLFTIMAYIISLGAIVFLTLSVTNRLYRLLCFFVFVITYPLFFGVTIINLIITVVFYLVFVAFDTIISFDINLHTRLALFHIYNQRLLFLVTVFSFLLSAQLWVSTNNQSLNPNISIPSPLINQTISFALPIIKGNIQDQLIVQIENQIPLIKELSHEDNVLLIEGTVSPATRDRLYKEGLTDEQINTFATELSKSLREINLDDKNIDAGGSFSVDTIVQQAVQEAENLLNEVITSNKEYLPWIISLIGFFILNSTGYILHFLAIFVTQTLLFIAVKLGLLKKITIQTSAERYVLNIKE